MQPDCPFCAIVAGEATAHEVYRDDAAVAFLDAEPAVDGHTLVVPTTHHPHLPDLPPSAVGPFFEALRTVVAAVERGTGADGSSVFQSNGAAAGQDVFHLHAHVLPRHADDDISFAPSRETLATPDAERVAAAIRAAV